MPREAGRRVGQELPPSSVKAEAYFGHFGKVRCMTHLHKEVNQSQVR